MYLCPLELMQAHIEAPTETREMVHNAVAQGEGKDHQGCLSAGFSTADADVQLPRI
jgi:hypothetical protein